MGYQGAGAPWNRGVQDTGERINGTARKGEECWFRCPGLPRQGPSTGRGVADERRLEGRGRDGAAGSLFLSQRPRAQ